MKKQIKWRSIFWLTLALLLMFSVTPRGYAQAPAETNAAAAPQSETETPQTFPYKKNFIISSYYTPLPGQSRYFTGTFEGDVRLNGEGVHAADGTLVYPGLAAASKQYPFNTKMEVPGFGIVAIHDRGGAIKGNRLDLWVGSGEEGLRRALGWGMRTVEVTVYGIDPNISESVNFTDIPLADIASIKQPTRYFKNDLAYDDEGQSVLQLQRFLKKLGYFTSEPTGYFGDETQTAVKAFQLEAGVIANESDSGAGNFGPRSRMALETLFEEHKTELLKNLPEGTLMRGDKGEEVKNLQEVLKGYGFLKEINGKYDADTVDAITRFQIDYDVIKTNKDKGAGFYGAKTKTAFERVIATTYTPDNLAVLVPSNSNNGPMERVFAKSLSLNDTGTDVEMLQEELNKLNFLALKPTGYYGKMTEHAVFKLQQAFNIVENENSLGAGVLGPKTMEKLNELVASRHTQTNTIAKVTEDKEILASRIADERLLVEGAVATKDQFGNDLIYGDRGRDVSRLQTLLKRLGFFPGRIATEYFGDITKQSLIAFQKSHNLEQSGNLDAYTRDIVNSIIQGA